jgi:hypothetical protein
MDAPVETLSKIDVASRKVGEAIRMFFRRYQMPPNKALQTDKGNLSCRLHSQKPRQLAFAAELGRYAN